MPCFEDWNQTREWAPEATRGRKIGKVGRLYHQRVGCVGGNDGGSSGGRYCGDPCVGRNIMVAEDVAVECFPAYEQGRDSRGSESVKLSSHLPSESPLSRSASMFQMHTNLRLISRFKGSKLRRVRSLRTRNSIRTIRDAARCFNLAPCVRSKFHNFLMLLY